MAAVSFLAWVHDVVGCRAAEHGRRHGARAALRAALYEQPRDCNKCQKRLNVCKLTES